MDEWDVDETGSVGFVGASGESLGWGVDGASSSLSSSQETVSAGLRAASSRRECQSCALMACQGSYFSIPFNISLLLCSSLSITIRKK